MDKPNEYCATYQRLKDEITQLSAMKSVLSRLTQKQETHDGQEYWKGEFGVVC
jgi:hypothetical protein